MHEGFQPDFPAPVTNEVNSLRAAASLEDGVCDLRALLWSSIDNTESRDLDQIEWAEKMPDGRIRVLVGVADVDAVVSANSATDAHARINATSVYSGGPVFPMLPERLSTDLTSLGQDVDRRAMIMEVRGRPRRRCRVRRGLPRGGSQPRALELQRGRGLAGKPGACGVRAIQDAGPWGPIAPATRSQPAFESPPQGARRA